MGAPAIRGGGGMTLVQGWWGKMEWKGREREDEIERDEDRLSTTLVPGWIPEMFDAESFINANLTA